MSTSKDRDELRRHILGCPDCKAFVQNHREEFPDWADTDPLKTVPSSPHDTHWDQSPRDFSLSPSEETLWPVQEIPGFSLIRILGRTRHSQVFLAKQESLDRLVAIKFVRSGTWVGWKEMPSESASLAALQHPNILTIFETGQWQDGVWLLLEYCPGGSLAEKLAEPWNPRKAAQLMESLARAVACANAAGIIHRDIKPANILFGAGGQPKLADFGIAHRWDSPNLSETGKIVGTPSYMAPEQVSSQTCDARTDVHALGAVLYHLLTGHPPFRGKDILETLHLVENQEPVRPEVRNPTVPLDIAAICMKCLAKDPAVRYQTAGDLAEDLHRFLVHAPVLARPLGWIARTTRTLKNHPALALGGTLSACALGLWLFLSWPGAKDGEQPVTIPAGSTGQSEPDPTLPLRYAADMRSLDDLAQKGQWEEIRTLLDQYQKDAITSQVRGWEWHYWRKRLPDRQKEFPSTIYRDWAITDEEDLIGLDPNGLATIHWHDQYEKPVPLALDWGGRVVAVAISPHGHQAAAVTDGRKLVVIKGLPHHPQVRRIELKSTWYPRVLGIFEDGKTVLGIDAKTGHLCRVDTADGTVHILPLGIMNDKSMISIHRDSSVAAVVDKAGQIRFWYPATGTDTTFQLPGKTLAGLNWSPDAPLLGAMIREKGEAGADGRLEGWLVVEPGKGHFVLPAKPEEKMGLVLPLDAGKALIVPGTGHCELRERSGKVLGTAQILSPSPLKGTWVGKKRLGLIQDGLGFTRVCLDDLEQRPRQWELLGVGLDIHWIDNDRCSLGMMRNRRSTADFSTSPLVDIRNLAQGKPPPSLTKGKLWSTRLETRSWVAAINNTLELHEKEGALIASHPVGVTRLASNANRIACLTDEDSILLFDERLNPRGEIPADGANAVGLDASGGLWVTTKNRTLARWDQDHWVPAPLPEGQRPTCYLRGKTDTIWVGTTQGQLWEFRPDGKVARQFQAGTLGVLAIDLDPTGRRLVVSTMDRMVRLYDLSTDRTVLDLDSLGDFAAALRFSPDGNSLAIGTINGKLVILP